MRRNKLRREVQVALSLQTQPVWFRVIKWMAFLSVAWLLRRTRWWKYWLAAVPTAGIVMHMVYRWKTQGWTRPWGGWNDVEPT
jgi:hypothetical protein